MCGRISCSEVSRGIVTAPRRQSPTPSNSRMMKIPPSSRSFSVNCDLIRTVKNSCHAIIRCSSQQGCSGNQCYSLFVVRNTGGSNENNGSMWSDCDLMNRSAFLPPQNDEGSVQYQRAVYRRNHLVPVNAGDNGLNRSFTSLKMRGGTDSAGIASTPPSLSTG